MSPIAVVVFMSVVANRLIDALVKPIYEKYQWDHFSLKYVSWVFGAGMVWFTGVNLFAGLVPDLAGLILTAVVAGGGSNFIYDLFGE